VVGKEYFEIEIPRPEIDFLRMFMALHLTV
jgi:hypothetical protein